jgi:hypothetical protein
VWDAKSGTMWTRRAAGGNCGISNSAVSMYGMHDRAIGVVDGKRVGCRPFVDNRERSGAEMGGATSVSNDGGGGGTGRSI